MCLLVPGTACHQFHVYMSGKSLLYTHVTYKYYCTYFAQLLVDFCMGYMCALLILLKYLVNNALL